MAPPTTSQPSKQVVDLSGDAVITGTFHIQNVTINLSPPDTILELMKKHLEALKLLVIDAERQIDEYSRNRASVSQQPNQTPNCQQQ